MIALAGEYAKQGKSVLLSTTTKLMLPKDKQYSCDSYFHDASIFSHKPKPGERVFFYHEGIKAIAPPLEQLERLLPLYDVVLLEADGSRQLGLKLHTERDPVVPSFVTATVVLASFATLGKSFKDNCFGCELFFEDFPEKDVELETFRKLLLHKQGMLKKITQSGLVLFNQVNDSQIEDCKALAKTVSIPLPLFFGSLQTNTLYYRKDV